MSTAGYNDFDTRTRFLTSGGFALPDGDWTIGIWDNNYTGDGGRLINTGYTSGTGASMNLFFDKSTGSYVVGGRDSNGVGFGSGTTAIVETTGTLPGTYRARITGKFTPRLHIIRRRSGFNEYLVAEAGYAPVLVSSEQRAFAGFPTTNWYLGCYEDWKSLYDCDLEGFFMAPMAVNDQDIARLAAGWKPSSLPALSGNLPIYFPMETALLSSTASSTPFTNAGSATTVGLNRLGPVSQYADGPMLRGAIAENNTPAQVTEPSNVVALQSFQPFQVIRHLNGFANVTFTGLDCGAGTADIEIRFLDVEHGTSTPWQTLISGSIGGGAAISATIPVPKGYWKTIEVRRVNSSGGVGNSSRPNRTWSRWAVGEVVVVWGDSIQGQVEGASRSDTIVPNGFTAKYPSNYPNGKTGDTNPLNYSMWNLLRGSGMGGGSQAENEIANRLSEASQCCVGISVVWVGATRLTAWANGSSAYQDAKALTMANGGLNKPNIFTWVANLASAKYGDDFYANLDTFKNLLNMDYGDGTWRLVLAPGPMIYSNEVDPGSMHKLREVSTRWVRDNPNYGAYAGLSVDYLTYDGVHPNDDAWDVMAPRWGNAVGYLRDSVNCADPRGGEIVNFYRSGGSLLVQVHLYAGTALSLKDPSANISGFTLSSDNFATTIPLTSAVLENATTVRLTPGSLPAGSLKLRYLFGKVGPASTSTLAAAGVDNMLYVNAGPTHIVAIQPILGSAANYWSLQEGGATPPPSITTVALPSGNAGDVYNQALAAIGGTSPYTWFLVSGTLPSGLTFGSGGVISGTPVSAGTSTFTIGVAGSDNASSSANFSLTVSNSHAPSITTVTLPAGKAGHVYNQTLAATGGTTPYTWSLVSGTLPSGLTLGSGGVISGTPSSPGTNNFTIGVAGNDNASSTAGFTLVITVDPPPSITTVTLPAGKVGDAYNQSLTATGGASPYTWSLVSGTLPSGMALGSDGVISGTPVSAGTSNLTIGVSGSDNLSSSASFSLFVGKAGSEVLYWDGNGTTAGAGNTTADLNKTWGVNAAWNNDSLGVTNSFTAVTGSGDDLFFVAGPSTTSGNITFSPTVTGTQAANSITFQSQGAQTLSSGTINLSAGGLVGAQFAYGTTNRGAVTISSAVALQASQRWINNATTAMTVSGTVSGTGDLVIQNTTTGTFTLSSASINPAGSITNSGAGGAATTLSGAVGSAVTGITQNSATSALVLSGTNTSYAETTTLTAGTLNINSSNALGVGGSLVINGGTLNNSTGAAVNALSNTAYTGGVTSASNTLTLANTAGLLVGQYIFGTTIPAGAFITAINPNVSITISVPATGTGGSTALTFGSLNKQTWAGDFTFTGTKDLNLGSGAISLGANAGGTRTVTVAAGTLTAGGVVSNGTNGTTPTLNLTKAGAGTLVLNGACTYSGITTLSAGTLSVSNLSNGGGASGIGMSSNSAANLVFNGGVLAYSGASPATPDRSFTLNTTGGGWDASGTGAALLTINASLVFGGTGSHSLLLTGTNTGDNTFATVIANQGANATNLVKRGPGTWVLTGANTYTGSTQLGSYVGTGANGGFGGTLKLSGAGKIGSGALTIFGGTLDLTGTTQTVASITLGAGTGVPYDGAASTVLIGTGGVLNLGGNVSFTSTYPSFDGFITGGSLTLSGNRTFTVNNRTVSVSSVIRNDASPRNVIKDGGGTLILSGANTYSGTTSINAGVLRVAHTDALQNSAVSVGTATGLRFSDGLGTAKVAGLNGASNFVLADIAGSPVAVTLLIGSTGGSYSGVMSGTGGLTKTGSGTQTLTNANTYTGATSIVGGTLAVNGSITSAVTVNNTGILSGSGIVAGTVNAAGTISPGAGVGTLTTGAATLGGSLAVEINGATADKLLSSSALTINGATLTVSLLGAGFTGTSYVIAEGASRTGTFASVPSGYSVTYTATQAILIKSSGVANYASWATTNGISGESGSGDFDGDGAPNLLEYAFGRNPTTSDTASIAPIPSVVGNELQISFPCDAACTDITYTVQSSSTLAADSWIDIATSVGGAPMLPIDSLSRVSDSGTGRRTVTVTDTTPLIAGSKQFVRVKVSGQ